MSEKIKLRAEARRQRLLKNSESRMKKLVGEFPGNVTDADSFSKNGFLSDETYAGNQPTVENNIPERTCSSEDIGSVKPPAAFDALNQITDEKSVFDTKEKLDDFCSDKTKKENLPEGLIQRKDGFYAFSPIYVCFISAVLSAWGVFKFPESSLVFMSGYAVMQLSLLVHLYINNKLFSGLSSFVNTALFIFVKATGISEKVTSVIKRYVCIVQHCWSHLCMFCFFFCIFYMLFDSFAVGNVTAPN